MTEPALMDKVETAPSEKPQSTLTDKAQTAPSEESEAAPSEGLRSRKKRETRMNIERCALELFLEHGYDKVTVEDICNRANISCKTFFNYFPSKLSVATGNFEPAFDHDQLFALFESCNQENYIDFIVTTIEKTPPFIDNDIWLLRTKALAHMPHILFQERFFTTNALNNLISALSDYLETHPEARMCENTPVRDEVIEALSVAICILQIRSSHINAGESIAEQPSAAETRHMLARHLLDDVPQQDGES